MAEIADSSDLATLVGEGELLGAVQPLRVGQLWQVEVQVRPPVQGRKVDAMPQALLMTGQDYAEFHAAFNAGREPRWSGR